MYFVLNPGIFSIPEIIYIYINYCRSYTQTHTHTHTHSYSRLSTMCSIFLRNKVPQKKKLYIYITIKSCRAGESEENLRLRLLRFYNLRL